MGGDFSSPLIFPGEKNFNEEAGALRVRVCTLFARVHVSVNVRVHLGACKCAHVCLRVFMHVCMCRASVHVYLISCLGVCVLAPGRVIWNEGIPRQSRVSAGPLLLLFSPFPLTGS